MSDLEEDLTENKMCKTIIDMLTTKNVVITGHVFIEKENDTVECGCGLILKNYQAAIDKNVFMTVDLNTETVTYGEDADKTPSDWKLGPNTGDKP